MRGEGGVRLSGRGALHSRQGLAWLFLVVNLTTSGRSYNQEMGRTPLGYFLPCVKWVDPLLVRAFEVGKHSPLIQILDTSLIRATPSARSLYKDKQEGSFSSLPGQQGHAFTALSLLLWDSS